MNTTWKNYLLENKKRYVDELVDLLRIPSVSTDPAYKQDVRNAAEWVANRLKKAGITEVEIVDTPGHPIVYAERIESEDKPTILIYGHFDVQPADPLELWNHPPFEAHIEDERIYARGASDMKGNVLLPIIACEALLQTQGSLPVNIKFMYEGEEEVGSPSLEPFIESYKEKLECDFVISADGGVGSLEVPTLTVGRRGIVALDVQVKTADTDMHSGNGGGIAANAIHELVKILDSLRDEEGRILVEGFYDGVAPLTDEERALIAEFPLNEEQFKENTGIKGFFGEPEYTPVERQVARATLEVNGIWGGYQGVGTKTVIPCEANAKITCRLVPGQVPEEIYEVIKTHLEKNASSVAEVKVGEFDHGADAYRMPFDHVALTALEEVITEVIGITPKKRWEGSTVPVKGTLRRILGVETVTLGASQSDKIHAPNEFFRLKNYELIQQAFCLYFQTVGKAYQNK